MTFRGNQRYESDPRHSNAPSAEVQGDAASIDAYEREQLAAHEVKSTPEEEAVISRAMAVAARIAHPHGIREASIPRENIHLLSSGATHEITKGEHRSAYCNRVARQIGVDRSATRTGLATEISHEMFHLMGGVPLAQDETPGTDVAVLDEGIVSELELRAYGILKEDELFAEERALTDRIRPWIDKLIALSREKGIQD